MPFASPETNHENNSEKYKNMKRPNITPGPWTTRMADCVYSDAKGRFIADCERTPFDKRPAPPDEQDRVNAKAIAAVPELLAALETFPEFPDDFHPNNPDAVGAFAEAVTRWKEEQARRALTKAGYEFP